MTAVLDGTYVAQWQGWRARRLRAATEAYGIAAAVATDFLDATPRKHPLLPGTWRLDGETVVGEGIDPTETLYRLPDLTSPVSHGGAVRLEVGEAIQYGRLRVVGFRRAVDRGLRIYDPTSRVRTTLLDIAAWQPSPEFVVPGRLERAAADTTVVTDQTDGGRVRRAFVGTAYFELAGRAQSLDIVRHHTVGELGFLSFSDHLSDVETFRFRFLDVEVGDDDAVVLDFNRAYLPPASFHHSYSCPLPLNGNRIDAEVRAGERTQFRAS